MKPPERTDDARLAAIWIKRAHGGPMESVETVRTIPGYGLEGSAEESRRRQVTIIEREAWEALMARTAGGAPPSARRANLMVSGIRLAHSRGRVLEIGPVRLLIGGETTPCERMEEAVPGLQSAMAPNWRGGAFAQILDAGNIRVGDRVCWKEAVEEPSTAPVRNDAET